MTAPVRPWAMRRAALASAATLVALVHGTPAKAASFCSYGTGAGQCQRADDIAVDRETGRLYVADTGNNRIDVFQAEGSGEVKFAFAFGWGVADGLLPGHGSRTLRHPGQRLRLRRLVGIGLLRHRHLHGEDVGGQIGHGGIQIARH